jgi:hypothetical protein
MDTILECNAPFYGEVITIYEPLACYRIHDANDSMQNTITAARFEWMARYFACRLDYLAQRCKILGIPFDEGGACSRSIWSLEAGWRRTGWQPSRSPAASRSAARSVLQSKQRLPSPARRPIACCAPPGSWAWPCCRAASPSD